MRLVPQSAGKPYYLLTTPEMTSFLIAEATVERLEASNAAMSSALKSIREHIQALDFDALGVDPEVGFSYRDEMVDSIDKALES